jgi:hypothetical protein
MTNPTETQRLPDLAAPAEAPPTETAPVTTGPKLIFNFSRNLGGHALEGIGKAIGSNIIAAVRLQLDLNAPVSEQAVKLCQAAVERYGWPDYIIPPDHAVAAIFIDRFFSRAEDDFPPVITYRPVIRLLQTGPNSYVFGGVE